MVTEQIIPLTMIKVVTESVFNPFLDNFSMIWLLKTPENKGIFKGFKMRTLARNGLISEQTYGNRLKVKLRRE